MGPLGPYLDDERKPTPLAEEEHLPGSNAEIDCDDFPTDFAGEQFEIYQKYCDVIKKETPQETGPVVTDATPIEYQEIELKSPPATDCCLEKTALDDIVAIILDIEASCHPKTNQCHDKYIKGMEHFIDEGEKAHEEQSYPDALLYYASVLKYTEYRTDLSIQAHKGIAQTEFELGKQKVEEEDYMAAVDHFITVLAIHSQIPMPEVAYPTCLELLNLCTTFYEKTVAQILVEQDPEKLADLMEDIDKNFHSYKVLIRLAKKNDADLFQMDAVFLAASLDSLYKETTATFHQDPTYPHEIKHVERQINRLLRMLT